MKIIGSFFRAWGSLVGRFPLHLWLLTTTLCVVCSLGLLRARRDAPASSFVRVTDIRHTLQPRLRTDPLLQDEQAYQSLFGPEPTAFVVQLRDRDNPG